MALFGLLLEGNLSYRPWGSTIHARAGRRTSGLRSETTSMQQPHAAVETRTTRGLLHVPRAEALLLRLLGSMLHGIGLLPADIH